MALSDAQIKSIAITIADKAESMAKNRVNARSAGTAEDVKIVLRAVAKGLNGRAK